MVLKGRLGLETARVPHADRHGLLWLSRGRLVVEDGTLHFVSAGGGDLAPGDYTIPFQMVSCILLGPGGTVSHDALRLLARHGTGLLVVGEGGIRMYAAFLPFGPGHSSLARNQARFWADPEKRIDVARRMYAWRLGEVLPSTSIEALRGIEGARMKETYRRLAESHGIKWYGRRYDRQNPESDDIPNQAINHAATAVEAAALIATAATGAIPSLGFIHEDASISFPLDIADLFRHSHTIPIAFKAAKEIENGSNETVDRLVRRIAGRRFRETRLIPSMIERIKELLS